MKQKKILFLTIFMVMILLFFTNKVQAMTIVIDPGHGGNDPGTLNGGLYEKNMTMTISSYLKEYLDEYSDVNVLLTHNGATVSLEDRADFARNNKADLLLSVHINSSILPISNGVEAYVTYRTDLPKYNQETSGLANLILRNISNLRNEK